MGIWLMTLTIKGLVIKSNGLQGMKGGTCTKKMIPAESILVELQDHSVIWNIDQKSYFITLSAAFLGPEGALE